MSELSRIAAGDRAAFAAAEAAGTPVVIAGGARGFRAALLWSPAYLEARIGGVRVRYKQSSCNKHPDFGADSIAKMFAVGAGTFGEFVHAITTGPADERAKKLFTGDEQFLLRRRDGVTTYSDDLRALLDDVEVPDLIPADRLYTVWSWFSGPGVRTWLHYDNNACHNLNAQITGRKTCWLFAPDELARLAPFPLGGANPAHNCSRIDVDEPGALAGVPRLTATLEAGDLLFIPAWWFHTFEHLGEFNSNVNFWWKPERPLANATAARQRLLELVAATGIDPRGADPAAAALRRLDELAISTNPAPI
jgi:hypothetical protein